MKHRKNILALVLITLIILSGCDYSKPENKNGFFYDTFAVPMDHLLHWLGSTFDDNYGLAIIAIVLIVRIIMLPFMLAQSKNGHFMRKKMEIIKPEMAKIQEKIKNANTQEEKIAANQEMMNKYKEYNMNPMKTMLGCLPLLVQMPILFGLYVSLKWPSSGGLTEHADFLWFDLTQPDIWMTIVAGILYIIQPLINMGNMPKEQRSMGYIMAIISPIFIIYISITSASALGLYWTINAAFLIIQMFFSNRYYSRLATKEANQLKRKFKNNNKHVAKYT
ncbi:MULTISPECIES: membrane protein insertase YidC [Staphylococcus]|nr:MULTISPECIES: membrane protein insertase YidC [Staphylococcus]PUZ34417.1 membrane protein insertase YidC [Staphylococcus cohnii]MBL0376039.1 membrane protein insertase YidC [Staphylococcus sp. S75]MBL0382861.1 membrane protein insertase YidC [Staphylococcus sp. S59]MBL0400914.1 membrane protein insertase YidC [Staphylococcus sp. S36]MCT1915638.1 membrane protein insertase YidC [Staphylococcus ureilyticus]